MKRKNGFTLIELLVVISIIGILTAISLVSYSGAQKQARDTTRRNDLNQYRNALENYATNNSSIYPIKTSPGGTATVMCTESLKNATVEYISDCIDDPTTAGNYKYQSAVGGVSYILYADLETNNFYYICSNGKIGNTTPAPAIATCDL